MATPLKPKEDLPTLKIRVAELERQVNEYKAKLDELRRAKATTVVKLEKEYVNTAAPASNRVEKSKPCERCDEFERMIETERKSNVQLKRLIEQKEKAPGKATSTSGPCGKCPELNELLKIEKDNCKSLNEQIQQEKKRTEEERNAKEANQRTLDLIQGEFERTKENCDKLRKENEEFRNQFLAMKKEHSEKMAELAQREEEAKKQVATWEQMYREWMATMERRVNNLQVTNEELQTWVNTDLDKVSSTQRPSSRNNQRR